MNHRTDHFRPALAALIALCIAVSAAPASAAQPGDRIDLRVLVLSANGAEPALAAWTTALTREGVPHDVLIANDAAPITQATLQAGPAHARYQAVVLASGGLLECSAAGCFSALDSAEWGALDAYQARFGVRRVVAYAYPTPEYGLNYPFQSGDLAGTTGQVQPAAGDDFAYLAGPVPVDVGSWGYLATPLSADFTTLVAGPAAADGTASALVGTHTHAAGFEELVMTVGSNPYQLHAMVLAHGLIEWATGGVHLGHQRNYFILHIDDIFLGDARWDMDDNTTYDDGGATNPVIRMSVADVKRAQAWQDATGLKLDMVFNGGGDVFFREANGGQNPMADHLLSVKDEFRWINHTYSHPNLDNSSEAEIRAEIQQNIDWAKARKLKMDPKELVTGQHSGLANPAMPGALEATGVRWAGSDNSRQPEPYALGPATTVPRHPSNVYYNVGTFEEQLDEYNWIYFENCTNTAVTTCLTAPATWAQYVDSEATIMLRHLLTNDPRPHYFHESNLAEDGTLYAVVDEVLARYNALMAVPLHQPTMSESAAILAQQKAWHAAWTAPAGERPEAYVVDGVITIVGSGNTQVPITGAYDGSWYGGDQSGWQVGGKCKKLCGWIAHKTKKSWKKGWGKGQGGKKWAKACKQVCAKVWTRKLAMAAHRVGPGQKGGKGATFQSIGGLSGGAWGSFGKVRHGLGTKAAKAALQGKTRFPKHSCGGHSHSKGHGKKHGWHKHGKKHGKKYGKKYGWHK